MTAEDHRHCKVCGRVCDRTEQTCSAACATQRAQTLRTRRLYTYVLYGLTLIVLVVFVLPYLGVR